MPSSLLFCDTSFFFASLVVSDPNHSKAKEVLTTFLSSQLITTWEIVSETVTLLRYRGSYRLAVDFLSKVKPYLELIPCDESIRKEAEKVFKKFSKDKRLSFCDCISYVVLSAISKEVTVLTFDHDFRQFGFSLAC